MTKEHDDRVRDRAYHLWQAGGGAHGQEVEHWLQAERDVGAADEAPPVTKKPSAGKKPKGKDVGEKGADTPAKKAAKSSDTKNKSPDTKNAKPPATAKTKAQRDAKRAP